MQTLIHVIAIYALGSIAFTAMKVGAVGMLLPAAAPLPAPGNSGTGGMSSGIH
jgi:hypothetical protein